MKLHSSGSRAVKCVASGRTSAPKRVNVLYSSLQFASFTATITPMLAKLRIALQAIVIVSNTAPYSKPGGFNV